MDFEKLLSRADEESLQALLGRPTLKLIQLLDPTLVYPSNLTAILLSLRSPYILLKERESRDLLLQLLRPHEARILCDLVGGSQGDDAHDALNRISFGRRSKFDRLLLFFGLHAPIAEEAETIPSTEEIRAGYPLFSHQRVAVRKVAKLLLNGRRRVLLHMPTGSGKTRTAMNVIAHFLRTEENSLVIWLAHSEELCEQAASEFEKAWTWLGNRDLTVYRFWGARELEIDELRDGLVVAGLSKVYSRIRESIQFVSKLGSRASLVVMDEAHQAVAPTYRLILDALVVPFPENSLLGLSATPGRTWADVDADAALSDFFARRKVSLEVAGWENPVDYLVSEGYLARVSYRPLMYHGGTSPSQRDLEYMQEHLEIPRALLERLAEDEQRNLRIVLEVESLAREHRRILVFASTVGHAEILAAVLRARGVCADAVTGITPRDDRAKIVSQFRENGRDCRVLCNFGVLTAGFDAPQTSAAVIARPTLSLVLYSQMVGRAIRGPKAGGNEEAVIVTVVDAELPGFASVADAFMNWEDIWED